MYMIHETVSEIYLTLWKIISDKCICVGVEEIPWQTTFCFLGLPRIAQRAMLCLTEPNPGITFPKTSQKKFSFLRLPRTRFACAARTILKILFERIFQEYISLGMPGSGFVKVNYPKFWNKKLSNISKISLESLVLIPLYHWTTVKTFWKTQILGNDSAEQNILLKPFC